jgi:chromosome segregation ATPase
MKKYAFFLLITCSCVSTKKYNALKVQMDEKDVALTEAKATIFTLNKQLEDSQEEKKALTQDLRKLTSSKSVGKDKDEKIHSLEQKIKDLEVKIAYLEKNQANTSKTNNKDNKTKKPKSAY